MIGWSIFPTSPENTNFFAYTVFCDPDFNAGRTKQMTDICEAKFDSFTELDRLVIIDRRKKCDCIHGVLYSIKWFVKRSTGTKCLPVPPFCFGFLDMCTVTEHNAAQIRGGECTDDFSFKTIFLQAEESCRNGQCVHVLRGYSRSWKD